MAGVMESREEACRRGTRYARRRKAEMVLGKGPVVLLVEGAGLVGLYLFWHDFLSGFFFLILILLAAAAGRGAHLDLALQR